jgi:hypothetical protein
VIALAHGNAQGQLGLAVWRELVPQAAMRRRRRAASPRRVRVLSPPHGALTSRRYKPPHVGIPVRKQQRVAGAAPTTLSDHAPRDRRQPMSFHPTIATAQRGETSPMYRTRSTRRALACTIAGLALAALGAQRASASTAYGDLNNFDVFNDTGTDCHGFEIELDDVRSTDITYTYDYNHYGVPTITEDASDPAHPKVVVRYAATYDAALNGFSAHTAVPAAPPSPTDGHQCTNPAVNIGCEHFGVGYYGVPTAVRYHWLVENPAAPGTLMQGPAVNVSTPTWAYYPPGPAQPVAQVQAVIPAPPAPEAPVYEFGDAVWVKSIVTTSHNNQKVELKDLVSDDPDDPADRNWRNGEPDDVRSRMGPAADRVQERQRRQQRARGRQGGSAGRRRGGHAAVRILQVRRSARSGDQRGEVRQVSAGGRSGAEWLQAGVRSRRGGHPR